MMSTRVVIDAQLPWSAHPADEKRFQRILGALVFLMVSISILISQIQLPKIERVFIEEFPAQVQELKLEEKKVSPPPVQTKPVEGARAENKSTVKPAQAVQKAQPLVQTKQQAVGKIATEQKTASKIAAQQQINTFSDLLADMNDPSAASAHVPTLRSNLNEDYNNTSAPAGRSERINTRALSGHSDGKVTAASIKKAGVTQQALSSNTLAQVSKRQTQTTQTNTKSPSESKHPATQRSRESIQTVFDQNKGAIYAIYNRALRSNPDLQGKVVFHLQINAQGQVTECRIVSSELKDATLTQKLIARIKLFNFGAIAGAQPWSDNFFLDFIPS